MKPLIVVSVCAIHALYCVYLTPPGPITAPDSAAYLDAAPIVPLGYPAFLKALRPEGAVIAQPLLFAIALAALGLELLRATSSLALALSVVVTTLATPNLREYHASILTESLFMSALVGLLAAASRFARQPSWQAAAAAAFLTALASSVRRTALAWLPVLALMLLLRWRETRERRLAIVVAATVPILGVLGADGVATHFVHGDRATSLAGRHLLAKASLIDAPVRTEASHALHARIEEQMTVAYAPIRDLIARAPREIRASLVLYYETCLQWPCANAWLTTLDVPEAKQNEALAEAAVERISRAPLNFLKLMAIDYGAMWTAFKLQHPETVPVLNQFLAANRPLPFEREAFRVSPDMALRFQPSERARWLQAGTIAIGWFTAAIALVGLTAAFVRRDASPALAIASLAALAAHGALLFSALFAAGIARFIVSVWPAVMTATLLGGWWVAREVLRRGP
jgi:hypothetical protein